MVNEGNIEKECIHGLGLVTACVICNGRAKREEVKENSLAVIMTTRFYGHCPECNTAIHVGEDIAWFPGRGCRTIHASCLSSGGTYGE